MSIVRCPEDQYMDTLAEFMDECSDELSRAGDGCRLCSCADSCRQFWDSIEPGRDNKLSKNELKVLAREFQQIRSRRQLLMLLTV